MCDAKPPKTKTPEWLSCQKVVERLLDYIDGALSDEERQKLERHFKLCPPCREFLRQYRCLPELCERALRQSMPDEAVDRLRAFLKSRAEDDPAPR